MSLQEKVTMEWTIDRFRVYPTVPNESPWSEMTLGSHRTNRHLPHILYRVCASLCIYTLYARV